MKDEINNTKNKLVYYDKLTEDEIKIFTILFNTDRDLSIKFLFLIGKGSFKKPKSFYDWKTCDFKFSEGDANVVSYLINKYPKNSIIVEMGVWKGWSTSLIIPKLKNKYLYVCIDWFKGSPTESCEGANPNIVRELFWNRMKENKIDDKIKLIEGDSLKVSKTFKDNSVDVFFLDGAHTEPYFSLDVKAWIHKIKIGGIFSGHDWSAVKDRAIMLFTNENGYEWINLPKTQFGEHDCWACKKVKVV